MKQVSVKAFCLQCGKKNQRSYVVLEIHHFSELTILECSCGNTERFRVEEINLLPVSTL